jgi:putative membrane protein
MRFVFVIASLCAGQAYAHTLESIRSSGLESWLVCLLLAAAGLYAIGVRRLWLAAGPNRGVTSYRIAAFAGGWTVLTLALMPPLDPLGAKLFSAHMLQHELLMLVAAPLLVAGSPLAVWAWALPLRWRRSIPLFTHARGFAAFWATLTAPLAAWLLHAAAIWLWHVPGLFTAALEHEGIHVLQHFSFLFSALVFWWAATRTTSPAGTAACIFSLFTTMVHTGALGALLVFAPSTWYPVYGSASLPWGLQPLEDQQLGGLIMWIPGGLVYAGVAIALMARWLNMHSRSGLQRPA